MKPESTHYNLDVQRFLAMHNIRSDEMFEQRDSDVEVIDLDSENRRDAVKQTTWHVI